MLWLALRTPAALQHPNIVAIHEVGVHQDQHFLVMDFVEGRSLADTVQQVLNVEPVSPRALNPRLPADLETVCLKCLEKEPGKRYATAQLLAGNPKPSAAATATNCRTWPSHLMDNA